MGGIGSRAGDSYRCDATYARNLSHPPACIVRTMPRQEFPVDGFDLGGGSLELSKEEHKSSPSQPRNLGLLRVDRFEERRRGFEYPVQPRFEDLRLERSSRGRKLGRRPVVRHRSGDLPQQPIVIPFLLKSLLQQLDYVIETEVFAPFD